MLHKARIFLLGLLLVAAATPVIYSQSFKEWTDVNGTLVKCHATALNGKAFVIEVKKEWAPLGAERFLELVKSGYFTDVPFFRVVHGFLTQFGITPNRDLRKYWRAQGSILDDPSQGRQIKRGYLSYAGGGPNTRDSQLFIAYEDSDWLGKAPWEVPLGRVIDGMDVIDALYGGYGDITPFGKGPDQQKIWAEGNEYLHREYPKLDYFKDCMIIPDGKMMEEGKEAVPAALAGEEMKKVEQKERQMMQQQKEASGGAAAGGGGGGGSAAKMGESVAKASGAYNHNGDGGLSWLTIVTIIGSIALFVVLMLHLSDKKADIKGRE